jgi:hypothetical protein
MDENGQKPSSRQCGAECTCNSNKGSSMKPKMIFLAIIIVVAGAVLGNSLLRKSRSPISLHKPGYSAVLPLKNDATALSSAVQKSPAAETRPAGENISFIPLASLSSLDTVAREVDGVFILLVNNETDKTPAMQKEIAATIKDIASRGMRVSTFHLNREAPDYAMLTNQMPAPGVLVIVKGRGMRGVQGSDITETKLLQAWIAAMQPTSCCPAGSKRVCK